MSAEEREQRYNEACKRYVAMMRSIEHLPHKERIAAINEFRSGDHTQDLFPTRT